jgi:hypothetical protein
MAQKPLQELSIAELNKQRSMLKGIVISYAIIWTLLLALNIYLMIGGKKATFAVSLALIPVFIPVLSALQKVNAELKRRNTQI